MSVYRVVQLIRNQDKIICTSLFKRLSIRSNQILKNNYSVTSNLNENNQNLNEINLNETNLDQSNPILENLNPIRQNKKERLKAEQNRLNKLRERLKNEDDLKKVKEFLKLDKDNLDLNDKSNAIIAKRRNPIPYLPPDFMDGNEQKVYIETYGCQVIILILLKTI